MKHIKNINEFDILNEKHHVNQNVRHLTNLIYNKIYQLVSNLIRKKEIVIENLLQDNYTRIKFKNDKIIIKLGKNWGGINICITFAILNKINILWTVNKTIIR